MIVLRIDGRMTKINEALSRVEHLQEELSTAQQESSQSKIVPTLQVFSQLYMDYLSRQQSGGEENPKGEQK